MQLETFTGFIWIGELNFYAQLCRLYSVFQHRHHIFPVFALFRFCSVALERYLIESNGQRAIAGKEKKPRVLRLRHVQFIMCKAKIYYH